MTKMISGLEKTTWAASLVTASVVLSIVLSLVGCSSAVSVGPTSPRDAMDDIQRLEVSIGQQMGVMASGAECVDRCRASSSICDSAARLCEIARELAEQDALERCRRAEMSCRDARRLVESECVCP